MFFFASLKVKRGLQKTYFLPLISVFTLVNSELRNFSSDKVTPKLLIINNLRCHLSLVTFAFTLSFMYYISFLCRKNLVDMKISCKFTAHIFTLITFSSLVCEDRRRFYFPQLARPMKRHGCHRGVRRLISPTLFKVRPTAQLRLF